MRMLKVDDECFVNPLDVMEITTFEHKGKKKVCVTTKTSAGLHLYTLQDDRTVDLVVIDWENAINHNAGN